jgi:hypothetical protein
MSESFTVFIDPTFDANERMAIGNTIVSYIVTRTQEGRGVDNVPFISSDGTAAYSKAYQAHQDFQGKLPAPINLTLTGSMLSSIKVLDISLAGKIEIGIEDSANAEKAIWMREKGYHFLGLGENEKGSILAGFSRPSQAEINRRAING